MGRKVRMVPPDWQHPKNAEGHPIPLYDGPFSERLAEWREGKAKWDEGLIPDYRGGWEPKGDRDYSYEEWDGAEPKPEEYMPDFAPGAATHFMMYEDTSEGTPISPAFATPEELARWLADNNASAFGGMTATYEQWLATCRRGFAVSAIMSSAGFQSGVEAMGNDDND